VNRYVNSLDLLKENEDILLNVSFYPAILIVGDAISVHKVGGAAIIHDTIHHLIVAGGRRFGKIDVARTGIEPYDTGRTATETNCAIGGTGRMRTSSRFWNVNIQESDFDLGLDASPESFGVGIIVFSDIFY
jgi:hypothetical protein